MAFCTVFVNCPSCGHEVEFTSHRGDDDFATYRPEGRRGNYVPNDVAHDIAGTTRRCPDCYREVMMVILPWDTESVPMGATLA